MLKRLFPWRYLLKLAAKRYDFIDPLSLAAQIRSFAQPSEVQEPIELLRAGIVFHARGLINTKAIQHNLDWVWPYWVERQFNPDDQSFIPRAFSFSHINLTHRNWTAVGKPDLPIYPIVDPRGLVTPLPDGWSIDCWFHSDDGQTSCPSRLDGVTQELLDDDCRRVITRTTTRRLTLTTEAAMVEDAQKPSLSLEAKVDSSVGGWLIFSLRPYNPEGVQFIEEVKLLENGRGWLVNKETEVFLAEKPERFLFSDYGEGDVFFKLSHEEQVEEKTCRIGMVTAAALYRVEPGAAAGYSLLVPLPAAEDFPEKTRSRSWPEAERDAACLQIPDRNLESLYKAATRTLIHLSAGDVIPGPYTYNRFWFRDACIMLNVLLSIGLKDRCRGHLDTFVDKQTTAGFFHSQDGEWDSNGQVLWLFNRYRLLTDGEINPAWIRPMVKAADWIARKRVSAPQNPKIHGLLPSGFSAEHFGPNDNYYWDDFWAVAGLYGAADTMAARGLENEEKKIRRYAEEMERALFSSIAYVSKERKSKAIPTSPNRRMDSGAIGCLVADYPLQLTKPGDGRMVATAEYLLQNCIRKGCFFQDMIHSGINIYMTFELAQVLLRAGDPRFRDLLRSSASLATPTGQWPEAIHPLTFGGCMGDGQHGWAVAEFLMLLRNMFIMEEDSSLIIGQGVFPEWLQEKTVLRYGPTLTPFGRVSVEIDCRNNLPEVRLDALWYAKQPDKIMVRLPGYRPTVIEPPYNSSVIESEE